MPAGWRHSAPQVTKRHRSSIVLNNVTRGFIDACEQEPLHLSGAIQPHGALLVLDNAGRVSHASRNLPEWLGIEAERLIGSPLSEALRDTVNGLGDAPGQRLAHNAWPLADRDVAVAVTRGDEGQVFIELLPAQGSEDDEDAPATMRRRDPAGWPTFRNDSEVAAAREALVTRLRDESGFDRVLFYAFLPGGDGEVLAEARSETAEGSYLGLRFPASDIPQVARDLYALNPWRTIPDARAESVEVLSTSPTRPDLSLIDLRSVSPVHRLYMGNMGVSGAISFPLMTANRLAGLISLHAYTPRRLAPPELRRLADEVKRYEMARREFDTRQRMELTDSIERRFEAMNQEVIDKGGLETAWPTIGRWLREEFGADGVMLDDGLGLYTDGLCLEPEALEAVRAWCDNNAESTLISESLSGECPDMPLSEVAGLLASEVTLEDGRRLQLLLCRREEVQEVAWGGNPDKPTEQVSGDHPIAPRRSFERWVEQRLGYSRPWPANTHLKLLKLRVLASAFSRDE